MHTAAQWMDLLDAAIDDFTDAAEAAPDLAIGVPGCPEWTLAGLVDHLRGVHHWAAHAIVAGDPRGSAPPIGHDRDALITGYVSAAEELLEALRSTSEDAEVWTFGPEPRVSFWHRRQVHEVTLHLRDALEAIGRVDTWTIDPALAWDGVQEIAEVFYPRQLRLERTAPLPAPLRLEATDVGEQLTLGGGSADGSEAGTISGTAEQVLLTLWQRVPATDPGAATLLAATAVTP